jgi:SsrA-binding protein
MANKTAKEKEKEKIGDSASDKIKEVASNRKAFHDYFIDEKMEAGIVLAGTEIKSVRGGRVNLRDAFARIDDKGELWLWNAHISPYDRAGAFFQHTPTRSRKLLMHKDQIKRLATKTQAKGLTLVPLRMYLKRGKAKVELGLARGKKNYDKRDALAERDANREIERSMKDRG